MSHVPCAAPGCHRDARWSAPAGAGISAAYVCSEHCAEIRRQDPFRALQFSPISLEPGGILTHYAVIKVPSLSSAVPAQAEESAPAQSAAPLD